MRSADGRSRVMCLSRTYGDDQLNDIAQRHDETDGREWREDVRRGSSNDGSRAQRANPATDVQRQLVVGAADVLFSTALEVVHPVELNVIVA